MLRDDVGCHSQLHYHSGTAQKESCHSSSVVQVKLSLGMSGKSSPTRSRRMDLSHLRYDKLSGVTYHQWLISKVHLRAVHCGRIGQDHLMSHWDCPKYRMRSLAPAFHRVVERKGFSSPEEPLHAPNPWIVFGVPYCALAGHNSQLASLT